MKTIVREQGRWRSTFGSLMLALGLVASSCKQKDTALFPVPAKTDSQSVKSLAIALAAHSGDAPLDEEIRRQQLRASSGLNEKASLDRLGWLFVTKARQSFDPGFYTVAERCAMALLERHGKSPEASLLLGHVLQSQHRFHDAEKVARKLVEERGLAVDLGLLGDVLVDIGRVQDAAAAYQTMLDLKPDPQGYARAAHIRWLKGDLAGAQEAMEMAARGTSSMNLESAAWMQSQLARYYWQSGRTREARTALTTALELEPNFPPALFLRGRMELSESRFHDAIESLRTAAAMNPLPDYQWALAEALREAGNLKQATTVDALIDSQGAASDARSCSLYFATTRRNPRDAERLARKELSERTDVFTHDALAWALASQGRFQEADQEMSLALIEGTEDARLFLHAAVITLGCARMSEATQWLARAKTLSHLLLPSEMTYLRDTETRLSAEHARLFASP